MRQPRYSSCLAALRKCLARTKRDHSLRNVRCCDGKGTPTNANRVEVGFPEDVNSMREKALIADISYQTASLSGPTAHRALTVRPTYSWNAALAALRM